MKLTIFVALISAGFMLPKLPARAVETGQPILQRIVFLGDSITDGHTYPLLVQQALRAAGQPVPVVINAGIGGDTAKGISARLERDVLFYKPTLVTLSAGINDALQDVPLAEYSLSITAIADRLRAAKIPLLILTTTIYSAKHAAGEKRADEYNAWLRTFAAVRGLKIAEVNALFTKTRAEKGETFIMETDGVHPNWEGQHLIARAVLDALGYPDLAAPRQLKLSVMPGVLPVWRMRVATEDKPLDAEAVQKIMQDDSAQGQAPKGQTPTNWKEYSLPETTPQEHPWNEQERQRGFALSLDKIIAPGKSWQGLAALENKSTQPKVMFFNTGAQLQSVWLNGERIYQHTQWRGWHAGRERIAATLKPGLNAVFIETGAQFFLSVTDDNQW